MTAQRKRYSVIVIGSGAGGGTAAYVLTRAGIDVLMLEAGRAYDPLKEAAMFNLPKDAPLRGSATSDRPFGYYDASIFDETQDVYTIAEGDEFSWGRIKMLGGRTNHWGRAVPRYGPDDFKSLSHTGYGQDWPIAYDDIAPYYDKVEALMGVNGPSQETWNSPRPNPATTQKPPAPRACEMLFAKACLALGRPVFESPLAILTQPQEGRAACFYASECGRGCAIDAAFQSPTGLIKPALKTGRLTLITDAMVYEILSDDSRKTTGVRYVDRKTARRETAYADFVVLAASAMESCRLLLNSKSSRFPNGLANSSGQVGRNITDSPLTALWAQIPALENLPPHNEDGMSVPHLSAPWWIHGKKADRKAAGADFFGGYKTEVLVAGRANLPTPGTFGPYLSLVNGLYGPALKKQLRRYYGSVVLLAAFGGMQPNAHCYCELDPKAKDRWGIPTLRFHWRWSEEDRDRNHHAKNSMRMLVRQMGGRPLNDDPSKDRTALSTGGAVHHEVGGIAMGNDPETSVLNSFSQAWDVPNLYVTDGAPFVTHAEKNPTLTLMALAWRAADNIVERIGRQAA